jgi:Neuraminidase (sialidase)
MNGPNVGNYDSFDHRAVDMWYLSDNEGETWRESAAWWAIPVRSRSELQEPGVVEFADGRLFCWARTDEGMQYGMTSEDGGNTWSAPTPTTLRSPTSPASIKRLPGSASLLAIWNDHSGTFPFPEKKRSPLVSGISSDNGATWTNRSCSSLIRMDGSATPRSTSSRRRPACLLRGRSEVGGLNRLRIRRVALTCSPG